MQTRLFSILVVAIWLGIYALRSYLAAAVWNLSDELPLPLKPVFAVATHLVGLIGVTVVLKWRRRALLPLAVTFATVTAGRQMFVASDAIGPYLALLSWPLWLWLAAAIADEVSAHDEDALIARAFAIAIALHIGMQCAWHGLDLASVRGWPAAAIVAGLAGVLVYQVARLRPPALARPDTSLAWLLMGPALFLELTLLGNVGRASEMSGASMLTSVVTQQTSLLVAVIVAGWATAFWLRVTAVAAGFVALFATPAMASAVLLLPIVQIGVVAGLREAADRRLRLSGAGAFAICTLILFGLIFGFYNAYELPPLWIVAFAPLAVAAALAQRAGNWPAPSTAAWFAAAAALAVLHLIPPPPATERRDAGITVMTYNIHHGFNDDGVPGMQRTAEVIANANPDLVALQEVGRGWTLLGGNDLIGYMRWRFPDYTVNYTPTNGLLWGLATMSRLPVLAAAGGEFESEPGAVRYGWSKTDVRTDSVTLSFYSVHVTPDLEGPMGDARFAQAEELQHRARGRAHAILAGDYNAHPQERPIKSMATGYRDLGAAAGLEAMATWPAAQPRERIDYVFGRGVTAIHGFIPRTTASDHLPLVVRVRFDDTTVRR